MVSALLNEGTSGRVSECQSFRMAEWQNGRVAFYELDQMLWIGGNTREA